MDLSGLYADYREDGWGGAAHHPKTMVALLVYSYCLGVHSSRQIERACHGDDGCLKIGGLNENRPAPRVIEHMFFSREKGDSQSTTSVCYYLREEISRFQAGRSPTNPGWSKRIKRLEQENRELKRANEILRRASAYFAAAELDRLPK